MGLRRRAREFAMQMLYQHEVGGQAIEELIATYLSQVPGEEESKRFARLLFEGVRAKEGELDEILSRYLANWSLSRLAVVDRAVLRIALYEFLHLSNVPTAVTINEAVELAKRYSTDESGKFVNGVLDKIRLEEKIDSLKTERVRESPRPGKDAPVPVDP